MPRATAVRLDRLNQSMPDDAPRRCVRLDEREAVMMLARGRVGRRSHDEDEVGNETGTERLRGAASARETG